MIRAINKVLIIITLHLFGDKYGQHHKMIVGPFIMGFGVYVSKIPISQIHFLLDMIGYAIHGIGVIPFIEHLQDINNEQK